MVERAAQISGTVRARHSRRDVPFTIGGSCSFAHVPGLKWSKPGLTPYDVKGMLKAAWPILIR